MNRNKYRLVFNKLRGMLIAVQESAMGRGTGSTRSDSRTPGTLRSFTLFSMVASAFAAIILFGAASPVFAQLVPSGAHPANVINTANGIQQANITKPSGAGVSVNTWSQFDVPKAGVILNNSPVVVQTQQAGYINGNPNFGANDAAKIILNQVNSNSPSQLRGYVEVAGQKADVVVANPSGIVVDGGGFINTARGILTTGNPLFDASGNLTGFNVTQGSITVQGDGFNASNIDEVDLISRAVQVNAALHANALNVVAGANNVDYASLSATPTTGTGSVPTVSIDVSQLGGMWSNRIVLVGNEYGVGVNNAGVIEAQAGDLTLTTAGQLVQSGTMGASGNVAINAASVVNSGSIYAQGATSVSTAGALSNTGTLAAQSDLNVDAGSVASSGVLGAGLDDNSNLTGSGNLSVVSAGALAATGTNVATGQVTLYGVSLDLAGSQISAGTALALTATGGNLALTGATVGAGTAFTASATGALDTSGAQIGSAGNAQLTGAQVTNDGGQVAAGSALNVQASGALSNVGGTFETTAASGTTTLSGASIDNTSGQVAGAQVSVSTPGNLTNRNGAITQTGTADQTVSAGGTLDNTGGTIATNAQDLTITAQTVTNDRGHIQHAGTGTLAVQTKGALSNAGGSIATNGALTVAAVSLDNTAGALNAQKAASITASSGIVNANGGQIYGASGLAISTQGNFDNTAGSAQSGGDVSLSAEGALLNAGGTVAANGATSTLDVSAASIDSTAGSIVNAGSGQTTISATGTFNNTGGVAGGNGDVSVAAQTLTNDNGGEIVGSGVTGLNVTQAISNRDGLLYGGTALSLNAPGATLDNTGGTIESGQDVSLTVASMENAGGAVRANQDISVSSTLSDAGEMTAGHDLTLALQGDFANDAASALHADNNLNLSTTGTFTSTGDLQAGNALTVTAANVINAAGADMNSAATTVSASNDIANAGIIEGDSVTTSSATLENTGAVMGNNVNLHANAVTNDGAQAVIAGATFLGIYAVDSLVNADGALIYSGGNMELARDSARDSSGLLADQTTSILNSGSSIEAVGNIDVAATTLTNERTGVVTGGGGASTTTTGQTLTLWTGGLTQDELGNYISETYRQWMFTAGAIGAAAIQALAIPLTVTLPASQVTNINTASQSFSLTTPLTDTYIINQSCYGCAQPTPQTRTITNNATQYYQSLTQNADGTVTISFYPDFDPAINILPSSVQVRTDLGSDNHDYVEMSRTVTTTTTADQLVSAGTQATIQAQGSISVNADGGAINNESSTMAAGGNLVRRADGGTVNDTGTLLQQTTTETDTSVFYWHQKTGSSTDTQTVEDATVPLATTTVASLPAIATANQAVVTDAQNINIASVSRVGDTVTGAGVSGGDATGQKIGSASAQTLAGGGIPGLTLPTNALYSYNTAPGASYLVATDSRFTSYSKFISSDYMLDQLGLNPQETEKRLGDGLYEEQLVMNQVTQLTGRTFLGAYTDNLDEYTALMNNGVQYAQAFNLTVGVALTDAQMAELTTDMVWLVNQTVTLPDGTTETVLVPKLYLAQSDAVDLQDSGALVAGNSVTLAASGDVTNSAHVSGDVATTIIGNNVVNRGGASAAVASRR
ncbi:filamentous hemagglutinin N-terminal domain-containing protein [Paraburkholderia sp. Ac-20347]|uniref:two-partner secretion domain-containing protein n=1 Tax=Paraburkholderia sp. Ac-20347 TaxID=2703892 RepID=UPI0032175041